MAKKTTRRLNPWIPALIWAGVIFLLSSYSTLPGPEIIWWDFVLKKSAHMFMFGMLFFWVQRATNWQKREKEWVKPLLITLIYAISDEYHQSFVPGRTALITDVGYDILGASMFFLKLNQLI